MPGYLINSGGGGVLDGQAKNVSASEIGTGENVLFTATGKTRVTSLMAVNRTPGILPIDIYIKSGSDTFYVIKAARVKKSKELIQISGPKEPDLLIRLAPGTQETTIVDDLPPEIILNAGDSLCASSLVNNSFDIIISMKENIK